jgi:hypothetical protein
METRMQWLVDGQRFGACASDAGVFLWRGTSDDQQDIISIDPSLVWSRDQTGGRDVFYFDGHIDVPAPRLVSSQIARWLEAASDTTQRSI